MFTRSEENYLKAIFHLHRNKKDGVSTSALAKHLETKAGSVTEMLKKLSDKKLVDYQKYYGASLTKKGKAQALLIIRKHRLWESFMVEKLGFGWDEVHEVAEQLEHIKSEKLTDAIDEFLGFPKFDPHGDPIPDRQGNLLNVDKNLLSNCEVGTGGVFVGVKDSTTRFLRYLNKQNISLGSKFSVIRKETFDNSLEIKLDKRALLLSDEIASNLYVDLR